MVLDAVARRPSSSFLVTFNAVVDTHNELGRLLQRLLSRPRREARPAIRVQHQGPFLHAVRFGKCACLDEHALAANESGWRYSPASKSRLPRDVPDHQGREVTRGYCWRKAGDSDAVPFD